MEIELNIPETEITGKDISVETGNTNIAVLEDTKDLDITYNRKEYSIIGDGIFISSVLEDVPEWLGDLIDSTFEAAILSRDQNLINRMEAILTALDYVPKNRYTEQINQIVDEDGIINTRIATLNSNLTDALNMANATIAEIDLTYASKNEAAAIATNVITASLSGNGEIGSALIQLQEAYADLESTTAQSINMLESVMEGEINGNATAMETIRTYVGISESGGSTGTGLLADVSILQKQNDGVIETITGTYDVMINPQDPNLAELVLTAEPYASWKAQDVSGIDTRLAHIGDVYIKYNTTSNGAREYIASYKFIRTTVDSTSPYSTDSDGFTWALIIDQAAQDAYQQSLNAYDLADNKRRVFTTIPAGPIDEGDLWVTGTNPQVVKVYKSGNWELSDTQVDNFISVTYTPTVTSLQNQIDGKIESWYTASTTDPKIAWTDTATRAKHEGDMWYQTDTKKSYWYSSSTHSWNLIDDEKAIQALANAATAQATADGVVVSFYAIKQDTAPTTTSMWLNKTGTKVLKEYKTGWINVAVQTGDTLIAYDPVTKDMSTYVYNGSGWITNTENGIVAGSEAITTLTANLSATNTTVGGHTTQLNTVDTRIANGVASVETKWAYNSVVNINGVYKKSGFGLATNYTSGDGTQANPYVSEFWIDASRLKFTNSNQTGQVAPFTIDATGVTPQITFNGKVSFSNVTNVPQLGSTPQEVVTAINNAQTTTINGPRITTGSITAAQIQVDSISADRLSSSNGSSTTWTGGGLVSQNFNGNVSGNIGSPTSGFRLSSDAAGTSTDPNIYGAYIQGSSVEVNSFKVRAEGYPNNFGGLNLVSGSTAIVGSGYSSGFDNRRVCSTSGSSIKLDCWARAQGNWIGAVLEYEANSSGNWIVIADRGMSMYGYLEYAYLNFAEFFNPSLVPVTGYVHFRIRLTSGNSGSTSGVVVTLSNG